MKNHYSDPTANTAIGNVERERRRAERQASPAPRKELLIPRIRRRQNAASQAISYRHVRFDDNGHILSSVTIHPSGSTPEAFLLLTF